MSLSITFWSRFQKRSRCTSSHISSSYPGLKLPSILLQCIMIKRLEIAALCDKLQVTCTLAITTDYLLLFLSIVYFSWSVWDMVHQQQLGYGDTIERYTTTEIVPYVQQIKRSSWAAQSGDLWCFKGNRIWCLNSTRRKKIQLVELCLTIAMIA